jgi:hypothetical protein
MTIEELQRENQCLSEVIFDLETKIKEYKQWIVKNDCDITDMLENMSRYYTEIE